MILANWSATTATKESFTTTTSTRTSEAGINATLKTLHFQAWIGRFFSRSQKFHIKSALKSCCIVQEALEAKSERVSTCQIHIICTQCLKITKKISFQFSHQKWAKFHQNIFLFYFWRENSNINIARFARNVCKMRLFGDFQTLWRSYLDIANWWSRLGSRFGYRYGKWVQNLWRFASQHVDESTIS